MGLEPTNGGTTNRCLNHLATLAMFCSDIIILTQSFWSWQLFSKFYFFLILDIFSLSIVEFLEKVKNESKSNQILLLLCYNSY